MLDRGKNYASRMRNELVVGWESGIGNRVVGYCPNRQLEGALSAVSNHTPESPKHQFPPPPPLDKK